MGNNVEFLRFSCWNTLSWAKKKEVSTHPPQNSKHVRWLFPAKPLSEKGAFVLSQAIEPWDTTREVWERFAGWGANHLGDVHVKEQTIDTTEPKNVGIFQNWWWVHSYWTSRETKYSRWCKGLRTFPENAVMVFFFYLHMLPPRQA